MFKTAVPVEPESFLDMAAEPEKLDMDLKLNNSVRDYMTENWFPSETISFSVRYRDKPRVYIDNVHRHVKTLDFLTDEFRLSLPKVKRAVEEVLLSWRIPLNVLEEDQPGMAEKVNKRGKWQEREFHLEDDLGWHLRYYRPGERLEDKPFCKQIELETVKRIEYLHQYDKKVVIGLKLVFPGRDKTEGGLVIKFQDTDARDAFAWKVHRVVRKLRVPLLGDTIKLALLEEDQPGIAEKVNKRGKWQEREFRLEDDTVWWLRYYQEGDFLAGYPHRGQIDLATVKRVEYPCLYEEESIVGLKLVFPGRDKTDGGLVLKFGDASAREEFAFKLRRVAPDLQVPETNALARLQFDD